jgi:hypothetical protein
MSDIENGHTFWNEILKKSNDVWSLGSPVRSDSLGRFRSKPVKYRLDSLGMKEQRGTLDLWVFNVKLSHLILLAHRVLRWLQDFPKICVSLEYHTQLYTCQTL